MVARVPDDHKWNALVLTARQRLGHGDSGGASFYLEDGAEIFSLDDLEDNDVLNVCFDEDGASCSGGAAPSSSTTARSCSCGEYGNRTIKIECGHRQLGATAG